APGTSGLQARAQITIFQGNVDYRRAGGSYAAANTGQLVRQGDSVRTTANAHAALTFFDGSLTVLEPASEIEVVSLRALSGGDIDVTLRQTSGRTWHVVSHQLTPQGHYAVLTPTSQTTVTGTAFQIRVDASSGATTVITTDGVVRTSGIDEGSSAVTQVAAGNSTVVLAKGARPQTP